MKPQDGSPLCYLVTPLLPGATDVDVIALLRAVLDECDRRDVTPGSDRLLRALLAYGGPSDAELTGHALPEDDAPTFGGFERP